METTMRNGHRSALGLCLAIGAVLIAALPLAGASPQVQRRRNPRGREIPERTASLKQENSAYRMVTIGVPGNTYYAALEEITEAGLAVGNYSLLPDASDSYSFLWQDGRITPLPYAEDPTAGVYMYGVNNRGLVIGTLFFPDYSKAAVFDVHRKKWTLFPDVTFKGERYQFSLGLRMNDSGHAVGFACKADWVTCVGWIWNGSAYSVAMLEPSLGWVGPLAINNRGDVVGQTEDAEGHTHAYLQDGSRLISLDVPGAAYTYVNDINDEGEVLLDAVFGDDPTGPSQSYIWRKGTLSRLPNVDGARNTYAYGLNNQEDFCGRWYDPDGGSHAFLALKKDGKGKN
jgi:probable HAF family extracellular repeat protein